MLEDTQLQIDAYQRDQERAMAGSKTYTKEVDLCAAFIEALPSGWTAYAETAGWDLLLVRGTDGFQIGIQAKLRLNLEVVNQALEEYGWSASLPGPDCRAILVPRDSCQLGFGLIAQYIGLTIIRMERPGERPPFAPWLPEERGYRVRDWHEWAPTHRHALPAYIPDVKAGAPAPVQLTDWKIKAMKITVLLQERGFVTRRDFSKLDLDHRRWLAAESPWIVRDGDHFKAGPRLPDFKRQHPMVFEAIRADLAALEAEVADKKPEKQGVLL